MAAAQTFHTDSLFQTVFYDCSAESWSFFFSNNISFNISGFWRLINGKQIQLISIDNGHQFGLDTPLNIAEQTDKLLRGQHLIKIGIEEGTGDLVLALTGDIQIQVFISSTGYETYDFNFGNERFIGMGAGEVAIFPN